MSNPCINIFWFRRDLRWEDNCGFFQALSQSIPVLPIFILDTDILDKLGDVNDGRVSFIYKALEALNNKFSQYDASLAVLYGKPLTIWAELIDKYNIKAVYTNGDYEPYALERDSRVEGLLKAKGISFFSYKDQVVFEKSEVTKTDGLPYTIFTPYSKVWKAKLTSEHLKEYPSQDSLGNLYKTKFEFPPIEKIGFNYNADHPDVSPQIDINIVKMYGDTRNFPAQDQGTTRLGIHLRFGTISPRKLTKLALATNEIFLNELIWREFFMQILYHFPQVVHQSFKPQYDNIEWRNNEEEFSRWREGRTGYPMVDAGMRELNQTGFMHNRVRMVVASFLTKHLLIDWRWGEAYFAQKLLDYDLSANNGNWQWAAGTGCDAAPYFRVFNPSEQAKKFDPQGIYIHRWLSPEDMFIPPMVEHAYARERALKVYKEGLIREIK